MPFVETRFISPTTLTTSAASALYTVPTGYSAIIKQLVVTNITGTAATFTFYIGAASAGNALFSGTSVAANDTVIINLSQVLTTGETLRALASTGSALNLTVSGVINDGPLASTATYIADNAITSAKIADGAIVNADINASAAIDKTKISGTAVTVADTGTVTSTMILDGTIATADIAANAVTQAKLSTDVPLSGMRNVLINGDMNIWQRSTSVAIATLGYTADRWYHQSYNGAVISQQPTSDSTRLPSTRYCARVLRNAGATAVNFMYFTQSMETSQSVKLAGQTATLSFWARAGAGITSSTFTASIIYGTGTDQNVIAGYTGQATAFTNNVTLTTTWQKFTSTGAVPTTATEVAFVCGYTPVGTAPANDYFEITNVQLEVGSQPTPFEQRPITTELSLCQRYYYRFTGLTSGGYHRIPSLIGTTGATGAQGVIYNPVPLRTLNGASSIEYYQVSITDNLTFDSGYGTLGLNTSNSSAYTTFITISSIAGTVTQGLARVLELKDTAGYIGVSAEL